MQGSRYGCGRHGEGIDAGKLFAQLLLYLNAEVLFLINNKQTKILEKHILRNQPMGADHNINLSPLYFFQYLLLLLAAHKTTEHRY